MDTKDRFGACVTCHKDMIVEVVSDGKVIKQFAPYKDETRFVLNDGSIMPVCICKMCKENLDLKSPSVQNEIMKSVIDGWKWETEQLVADEKRPEWTQEFADKYMEKYKKFTINSHKGE